MKSPAGYKPGVNAGWHHAVLDPGLQKTKKDNKDLKKRMSELEATIVALTTEAKDIKNGS